MNDEMFQNILMTFILVGIAIFIITFSLQYSKKGSNIKHHIEDKKIGN
jgi:hypothetical protein